MGVVIGPESLRCGSTVILPRRRAIHVRALALLLLPAAVSNDVVGEPRTQTLLPCDGYWLVEESDAGDYSKLDVQSLGFQTNRSICTNGDDSLAGKAVSLTQYLDASHSAVAAAMKMHLLPRVRGGAATRDLIIQDLESPKGIHPRIYGELNDTQLALVVKATKLRLQAARELMVRSSIITAPSPHYNMISRGNRIFF